MTNEELITDEMMMPEDDYKALKSNYLSWETSIDGKDFTVFIYKSKVILFERKVYYKKDSLDRSVWLHALRIYKSLEDAENNIDGDLAYFIYAHPVQEGDIR